MTGRYGDPNCSRKDCHCDCCVNSIAVGHCGKHRRGCHLACGR